MDCQYCITNLSERKSGQHLQREERGAIQALNRQGLSNKAIARELGCSPTTVGNELKRGTPPHKSSKGRAPCYNAKRGEAVYRVNRSLFLYAVIAWVTTQVENTSGHWMPASAMPGDTACFPLENVMHPHTLQ